MTDYERMMHLAQKDLGERRYEDAAGYCTKATYCARTRQETQAAEELRNRAIHRAKSDR